MAQLRDMRRLKPVGDFTVVGASGDMSDFQYISQMLDNEVYEYSFISFLVVSHIQFLLCPCRIDEFEHADGHALAPSHIYEFLCRVMYGRRSQSNPLWNSLIVGGFKDGKSYVFAHCG